MAMETGQPLSSAAQKLMQLKDKYSVGGFAPTPGFLVSVKGSTPMDVDGKEIIDFVTMFSATNIGHDHLKLIVCGRIARKWGVTHKKIPAEEVIVLETSDNYHDLTSGIWPIMNTGNQAGYAPFNKNLTDLHPRTGELLRYGHVEDFEAVFSEFHGCIAGVIMECIHGKLPTFQEKIDFAIRVRQLCKRYNVLFVSDEIRMGSGKTGKFLCSDWLGPENRPDMITLGKSITGGALPASYMLGYDAAMSLVGSFQTGGTFTMAPAAVAATMAALKIYDEEKLTEKALIVEDKWKKTTSNWNYPWVKYVTSRGADMSTQWSRRSFIYPTKAAIRVHIVWNITDEELEKGLEILTHVMDEIES